jgi:hypothetical protein
LFDFIKKQSPFNYPLNAEAIMTLKILRKAAYDLETPSESRQGHVQLRVFFSLLGREKIL